MEFLVKKGLFVFSVLVSLFLAGCANSVNPFLLLNQAEHEYSIDFNQNELLKEEYVKISGKINIEGAIPSIYGSENNSSGNALSKTAMPANPAEIIYEIQLRDTTNSLISTKYVKRSEGGYEIAAPANDGKISISGYVGADQSACSDANNCILSGSIAFTKEQLLSGENIDIAVSPVSGKTGTVKLPVCVESTSEVKSYIAYWKNNGEDKFVDGNFADTNPIYFYLSESGTTENVSSGVYDVSFIFYSENSMGGNVVYRCTEKINVFGNMETDTWYGGGSPHIDSGNLKVSSACVSAYKRKDFYVSSEGSVSGIGTYFEPCTISTAWSYIKAVNDGVSNYNIYIMDDITASSDSDIGSEGFVNFSYSGANALNLTVSSYNNPATPYKIDAARTSSSAIKGRVMYVSGANFHLELKNIQITGGYTDISVHGGGLYISDSAELTVGTGCKIYGNYSGCNGGAIYLQGAGVTMNGGEITENISFSIGCGVFNDSGTFTITGGKIWNNAVDTEIYDDKNADYCTNSLSNLKIKGSCYIEHIALKNTANRIDIIGDMSPLTEGGVTYLKIKISCGTPPKQIFDASNPYFLANYSMFESVISDCIIDTSGKITFSYLNINGEIPYSNMISIAGGTVTGSDDYKINSMAGVFVEGRTLTIPAFKIGAYEVTQRLYKAVMTGDSDAEPDPSYCVGASNGDYIYSDSNNDEQDLRPVENVNWYDAVYFCNRLSERTGKTPFYEITGITWGSVGGTNAGHITSATVTESVAAGHSTGYRLPYEAEWEYVARGTVPDSTAGSLWMKKYAGSDTSTSVCWYLNGISAGNPGWSTHRVGLKSPVSSNILVYDLSGNNWEWCWDLSSASIDATTPLTGVVSNGSGARVYRGGAWRNSDNDCVVTKTNASSPTSRENRIGFRIVCSVE